VNYAKLLETDSFFTWHIFLQVGKTQDLPSKFWQTLGVTLSVVVLYCIFGKKKLVLFPC
jgi:hypothetical protein